METPGQKIAIEAFDAFDKWSKEHSEELEGLTIEQQVDKYAYSEEPVQNNWLPQCGKCGQDHPTLDRLVPTLGSDWVARCGVCGVNIQHPDRDECLRLFNAALVLSSQPVT